MSSLECVWRGKRGGDSIDIVQRQWSALFDRTILILGPDVSWCPGITNIRPVFHLLKYHQLHEKSHFNENGGALVKSCLC